MESNLNLKNLTAKACASKKHEIGFLRQDDLQYNSHMADEQKTAGGEPMDYSTHDM
jgi:hypothetical protein